MQLTSCQAAAEDSFLDFLERRSIAYGLFGYAGTGKSMLTSRFLKQHILGTSAIVASPTHKAAHVVRRFLRQSGVDYTNVVDPFVSDAVVVGTTAQLLGIRPDVVEDQDESDMVFRKSTRGLIESIPNLDWILIDEVSMLSAAHLAMVIQIAKQRQARVMVIGDPGQLPPVNAEMINFKSFNYRGVLKTVCRTSDETGITALATAVRSHSDWRSVRGSGVHHVADVAGAYIANTTEVAGEDEREWSVYVAYRNAAVNAVNEILCRKIYGHGRNDIAVGEVVLANNGISQYVKGLGSVPLCTNGETLVIEHIGMRGRWGVNVTVRSVQTGNIFVAEYLPEAERLDPDHPFNVEVRRLRDEAKKQQQLCNDGEGDDAKRRIAWASYFGLRDNTVLSVSHRFALTAHKSQGSTYRRAFVDASDMAAFDPRALYVGVTRPSEELVIG